MADRMITGPDGKPMFISDAISIGHGGVPIFIGHAEKDPQNRRKDQVGMILCPVCSKEVNYLVGQTDTETGEVQGCEGCYKPPVRPKDTRGGDVQNDRQPNTDDPTKVPFD